MNRLCLVPIVISRNTPRYNSILCLSQTPSRRFSSLKNSKKKRKTTGGISPKEGIETVKNTASAKFDETVEVAVQLGLDPRKPNQSIRTIVPLPHGSGKRITVAAFATGEKAQEAREAGAEIVGGEELVDSIINGTTPLTFNRVVATLDVLPSLKKAARLLGPKGLMPNLKSGNVTDEIKEAVTTAKRGAAPIRTDRFGIVRAGIGKISFQPAELEENLKAFLIALVDNKPEGAKGKYFLGCHISSTMGEGILLDIRFCDPSSNLFMLSQEALKTSAKE